jgi:threonine/homoserine/homoserine lactone efflux protein
MTQPAAQPAATDKVTLWGVLGIVFAFCCWPLGIVFSVLGLQEAKRVGKQPTLAYIGFGLAGLFLILTIVNFATGAFYSFNK